MTSKTIGFQFLMILLMTVFCMGVSEVTLSLAGYSGEISESGRFLTTDPHWTMDHWWRSFHNRQPMPTVRRIRQLKNDSQGSIEIHEHTFSVKKPKGITRIIFIGDSGTYGTGVLEKHTYVNLIRKALPSDKYEVINAGVPGYSPTQTFQQFLNHLVYLEPDIVIYTMFLANDVLDLMDDPYIDRWNRFIPQLPAWLPFKSSALVNFIRLSIAKIRYRLSKEDDKIVSASKLDEKGVRLDHNSCTGRYRSYLTPLHPRIKGLWKRFQTQIEHFDHEVQKQDISWSIFILPTHTVIKGEFVYLNQPDDISCLKKAGLKYEPEKVDSELPLKKVLSLCQELKLHCINPTPQVKRTLGLDFYIHKDDHPNQKGHKLLSEILLDQRPWVIQ